MQIDNPLGLRLEVRRPICEWLYRVNFHISAGSPGQTGECHRSKTNSIGREKVTACVTEEKRLLQIHSGDRRKPGRRGCILKNSRQMINNNLSLCPQMTPDGHGPLE